MWILLKIAWRNIWRNRTRSLVVIFSLIIGIWATVFILAVSDSLHAESLREGMEYKYGHVQIHSNAFKKRQELGNIIPDAMEILEGLKTDHEVSAAATRLLSPGMIATAGFSSNVQIRGVLPIEEETTTLLQTRLTQGSYLDIEKRNPIIVGEKLLSKLKTSIGKKVVLTFENPAQDLVAATFRIAGTFASTQVRDEETMVFVKKEDLSRLAEIPGAANEIIVKLVNPRKIDPFIKRLTNQLKNNNITIESWEQAAPDLAMLSDMIFQTDLIVTIIVLLALAFGIVNTMLMAVLERFKELGILMAVGMNKFKVFAMIVMETTLLSLAGGAGGMLLGFLTVLIVQRTGVNLSLFSDGLSGWGFKEIIHPELEARVYIIITIAVIITAVLASFYPAIRALSLNPSDAIRKEI